MSTIVFLSLFALIGSAITAKIEKQSFQKKIQENCHSAFPQAIKYFATKTPYIPPQVGSITPEDCTAEQIWILNRHGTRYPGDDDIIDMLTALPVLRDLIVNASLEGQGNLCEEELQRIRVWQPNPSLNISEESWLVDQGRRELFGIGQRWKDRLSELLPKEFSNDTYFFRSTEEERTIESAKSFAEAIFGADLSGVYFNNPIINDPILHFYENCTRWIEQVDDNPDANIESNRFTESTVIQTVVSQVQERLFGNVSESGKKLSLKDIQLMYMTCTFETAWEPQVLSPWCSVFTQDDFIALEYSEDLEDYWKDGYAYPITYEQACTPLKDLLERFSSRVNGESKLLTTAYFGHSGTLLKFYGRLGLFRDSTNLTSDGFQQFSESRQWRSSKIGTFASNIAFTLFHCPNRAGIEEYQIGTLVQENPTAIPACDNNWICPYDKFLGHFLGIADKCNLQEICQI